MTRAISVGLAVVALALAVVGAQGSAQAQDGRASLQVNLMMADGGSYDHRVGGGTWGDGPGGEPGDVWHEQQWPPHYACGDVVSFLMLISSTGITGVDPAPRTVEVDLRFDAATSGPGRPGAGYSSILDVAAQPNDPATVGDRGSVATLVHQQLQGLYEPGGQLTGTVRVNDIEVDERVVVRVDVRASCSTTLPHAGILYAQLDHRGPDHTGFREVAPDGPRDLGAGQNLVQMVQVNGDPLGPATPPSGPPVTTPPSGPPVTTPPPTGGGGGGVTTSTVVIGVGPGVAIDKQPGTLVDLDDSGSATVGDRLDHQIVVTNTGDVTLTGVVVTDPKPGTTAPVCPGLVGGVLPVGASVTCTVSYTLTGADVAAGSVENTATVDTNETGPSSDTAITPLSTGGPGTTTLFAVSIPATGVSVLPSGPLTLPRTGSDATRSAWWAAAFIAAGLSLVTAATGRRSLHEG